MTSEEGLLKGYRGRGVVEQKGYNENDNGWTTSLTTVLVHALF